MLFKNDEREGTVVAVGADGEGIVKDEGYTAFVPFALTGEKIRRVEWRIRNTEVP